MFCVNLNHTPQCRHLIKVFRNCSSSTIANLEQVLSHDSFSRSDINIESMGMQVGKNIDLGTNESISYSSLKPSRHLSAQI